MRKITLVMFLVGMFLVSGCTEAKDYNFLGEYKTVTKVIDGDTVVVEGGDTIRLLGIDADERGYDCYIDAKERLENLVLGKEVYLESEIEDKDIYGRYLRYLILDDVNINLELVKEGFVISRFSPDNEKYREEIIAAEQDAKQNKRGCKWKAIDEKAIDEVNLSDTVISGMVEVINIGAEPEEVELNKSNLGVELDIGSECIKLGCPEGTMLVGSVNSDKYHECTCRYAKKILKDNLVCFKSEQEAKSQGYIPCKACLDY